MSLDNVVDTDWINDVRRIDVTSIIHDSILAPESLCRREVIPCGVSVDVD